MLQGCPWMYRFFCFPERFGLQSDRAGKTGFNGSHAIPIPTVRDEYLKQAQKVIPDPNILINVVSRRVKQLRNGMKPLVESLEKLNPEDVALREVIEGKITYELFDPSEEEERS